METLVTIYLAALTAVTCILGALAIHALQRASDAEYRATLAERAVEDIIALDTARRRARQKGHEEMEKIQRLLREDCPGD